MGPRILQTWTLATGRLELVRLMEDDGSALYWIDRRDEFGTIETINQFDTIADALRCVRENHEIPVFSEILE